LASFLEALNAVLKGFSPNVSGLEGVIEVTGSNPIIKVTRTVDLTFLAMEESRKERAGSIPI
jgi:hypothetical protein